MRQKLKQVAVVLLGMAALRPISGWAQQAPAAAPAAPAPVSDYERQRLNQLQTDWPMLKRFHDDDVALPAPAVGEDRVVFMGDSITQGWMNHGTGASETTPGFFPGKPWVNRGISGQTTPQMVLRFRQDVIALKPKVVVILAGTNDIAGNTGPMTPEQTEDNLSSMADLATANGIRVVLCSITPAFDFPWKRGMEPAPKVMAINSWIKSYAASKGYIYVDYYSAMADAQGGLPETLSKDGVHPTAAGYAVMNPLVEAGIAKALGK
jgi:lysophospholipase L1-like esterase